VSEEGGVHELLYKEGTRCPFKGCGALITAPKQEDPFTAWTTGQQTAPAVTHDRKSIHHLPIPIRNDVLLAEAGKGLYKISDLVRQALEQEDLKNEDGVIHVAHLLHFLAHGPLASRFRGKDEVLTSLDNPQRFGAYDLTSCRAVVRDAKAWRPSSISRVIQKKPEPKVLVVDNSLPTLFVLCVPKDKGALQDLRVQLARRANILSDDSVSPGGNMEEDRRLLIERSDGIILMLSASSAAEGLDEETAILAKSGKKCAPFLVSAYDYKSSAVGHMQCMNRMKPVKSDKDWMKVSQEIRRGFNIP